MWLYNILIFFFTLPGSDKKGNLLVEIKGIKEITGNVHIGLYNKAEGFTEKNKVFIGKIAAVKSSTMVIELTDIPYGSYAITAFHDANSNGELDKNFFGVPVELYGFSNNARGTFGPPYFNDARFELNATELKVTFEVK